MKNIYRGPAVYWQGKNELKKGEIKIENIKDGEALIEVKYCGICGTDIAIYNGIHPRAKYPLIMGHEFSGVVREIRSDLFKSGDHVVVNPLIACEQCVPCKENNEYVCQNLKLLGIDANGGFAKYAVVDAKRLLKIPDDLDLLTAALVEPFATGVHAFWKASPKKDDLIVILGGGPIGFATGLFFKNNGIEKIYFSEISNFRLKILKKFGFHAIDPCKENLLEKVKDISQGKLADIVIMATGTSDPAFVMVSLVKVLGLIILVGIAHKPQIVDLMNIVFKELTIKGVRVYRNEDFIKAIDFVSKNKNILKGFISKVFPLEELEDALKCTGNPEKSIKIIIEIK
jgi:2-desacetyl-2-hydroxyethyl bacteriochlorophyllide A dehydrogenase